jgi:hypothetical protein
MADRFWKDAVIEVAGGLGIEHATKAEQTAQLGKPVALIDLGASLTNCEVAPKLDMDRVPMRPKKSFVNNTLRRRQSRALRVAGAGKVIDEEPCVLRGGENSSEERIRKINEAPSCLNQLWCLARVPLFVPDGTFIQTLDMLILACLAYTSFFTTYQLAFGSDEHPVEAFEIDMFVMVLFFLDMIIQCNLAYADQYTGSLITNRDMILSNYFYGWFLIDLASTIPWDLLGAGSGGGGSTRLIRLLRLAKLLRLLRKRGLAKLILQESDFKMSTWVFMKIVLYAVVTVHWCACLWMLMIGP